MPCRPLAIRESRPGHFSRNHSCIPNADRSFIGNMMVFRANREIELSEEIYMSYCNSDNPYPERMEHLSSYSFECDCQLTLQYRDELLQQLRNAYPDYPKKILVDHSDFFGGLYRNGSPMPEFGVGYLDDIDIVSFERLYMIVSSGPERPTTTSGHPSECCRTY